MAESDTEGPRDRHAYLEEQIQRQKRGEPIDVDWVRAELERVRREQVATQVRMKRQLRLLVILSAAALLGLWIRGGALRQPGGVLFLVLIAGGVLAAWLVGRRRPPS